MIVLSTIIGIILLAAGGFGLTLTFINYPVSSFEWVNGLLTYGVFTLLGLAIIIFIVMTPKED